MVVAMVAVIAFIVFVESARRKIPVSYAKRHVGRQLVGGQQTTMPLKLNMGGVIPVIFASSVLSMPQSLFSAFPPDKVIRAIGMQRSSDFFQTVSRRRSLLRTDLSFADCFLHVLLRIDCFQRRGSGGQSAQARRIHAGHSPGRATSEYLNTILTRLTIVGAVYLALVAFLPQFMLSGFKVARLPWVGAWLESFVSTTPGLGWIPGDGLPILLRRHVAFDFGRRGDGHRRANRSATRDAKLRRLSGQRWSAARPQSLNSVIHSFH